MAVESDMWSTPAQVKKKLVFISKKHVSSTDVLSLMTTLHFFQKGFLIHSLASGCDYSIAYSTINFAYFESKILMQKNPHTELFFHLPRGGPCVISISIPSGIRFHLSSKDWPLGRLKPHPLNHGVLWGK